MAWRRPGDNPLSEPMMVILLTHIYIYIYASLGLNELIRSCSYRRFINLDILFYSYIENPLKMMMHVCYGKTVKYSDTRTNMFITASAAIPAHNGSRPNALPMWCQVCCFESPFDDQCFRVISRWRHYMNTLWSFVGRIPMAVTGGFPSQWASNVELWYFMWCDPEKLLKKQSSNQWYKTAWCSCDVIVMFTFVS